MDETTKRPRKVDPAVKTYIVKLNDDQRKRFKKAVANRGSTLAKMFPEMAEVYSAIPDETWLTIERLALKSSRVSILTRAIITSIHNAEKVLYSDKNP